MSDSDPPGSSKQELLSPAKSQVYVIQQQSEDSYFEEAPLVIVGPLSELPSLPSETVVEEVPTFSYPPTSTFTFATVLSDPADSSLHITSSHHSLQIQPDNESVLPSTPVFSRHLYPLGHNGSHLRINKASGPIDSFIRSLTAPTSTLTSAFSQTVNDVGTSEEDNRCGRGLEDPEEEHRYPLMVLSKISAIVETRVIQPIRPLVTSSTATDRCPPLPRNFLIRPAAFIDSISGRETLPCNECDQVIEGDSLNAAVILLSDLVDSLINDVILDRNGNVGATMSRLSDFQLESIYPLEIMAEKLSIWTELGGPSKGPGKHKKKNFKEFAELTTIRSKKAAASWPFTRRNDSPSHRREYKDREHPAELYTIDENPELVPDSAPVLIIESDITKNALSDCDAGGEGEAPSMTLSTTTTSLATDSSSSFFTGKIEDSLPMVNLENMNESDTTVSGRISQSTPAMCHLDTTNDPKQNGLQMAVADLDSKPSDELLDNVSSTYVLHLQMSIKQTKAKLTSILGEDALSELESNVPGEMNSTLGLMSGTAALPENVSEWEKMENS